MIKQKVSKTQWSSLPQRPQEHIYSDLGVRKFCELFTDPWFITREEAKNDYGVDVVLEALIQYLRQLGGRRRLKSGMNHAQTGD